MREMKDSGIKWIGEIPQNWGLSKVKYVASIASGIAISKECYEDDGRYEIVGANGVVGYYSKWNNKRGCLTTGRVGTIGTVHKIEKAWVTDNALIVYENENIVQDYLKYVIPNFDFKEMTAGTAMPLITATKLYEQFVPMPRFYEQVQIAAYLDSKCSEIDAISADIQKEIEILEQFKRSIITEAVTKGLNPDAEMKDSGIEWVGNIPAHWDIHPLYYYFSERKKKNYLGKEQNLLSLSYGKVIRKDINTSEGLLPDSFNGYNIIEPGDIVLRLTDLQNDKRSLRTGLVKEHGIITSAYVTLKAAKEVIPEYFHYLLHAYDVMKVLYNMGNGVRQGLNYSELSKMHIVAPPIDEQKNIVVYLDSKCKEIESIIASKKQQLTVIDSYKKSLIYEYVTGKKEVV